MGVLPKQLRAVRAIGRRRMRGIILLTLECIQRNNLKIVMGALGQVLWRLIVLPASRRLYVCIAPQ